MLEEGHIDARGSMGPVEVGEGEERKEFLVGATPFLINGQSLKPQTPPKTPGADTDAVLAELGYSAADVAALKGSNAV